MAAEPVSPLVATRTVRSDTSLASRRATTWSAWSLKLSVGPQNSSRTLRSPTSTIGVMSGWLKAAAASATRESGSGAPNALSTPATDSTYPHERQPSGSDGISTGVYRPPSGASTSTSAPTKSTSDSDRVAPNLTATSVGPIGLLMRGGTTRCRDRGMSEDGDDNHRDERSQIGRASCRERGERQVG